MRDAWPDPLAAMDDSLPERLKKALAVLRDSDPRHVGLEELSLHTGVSKYHLSRLFRRHLGAPPHRFQQRRRLALAAHLLRRGERPVDVAVALAFTDPAHLCRRFKRAYGVSPSKYATVNVIASNDPTTEHACSSNP
jgi:AraC-like DNA-binding protein